MRYLARVIGAFLLICLSSVQAVLAAPSFSLGRVDITPAGSSTVLTAVFTNDGTVVSLQFDIEYDATMVTVGTIAATSILPNAVNTQVMDSPNRPGFTLQRVSVNATATNDLLPPGGILSIPISSTTPGAVYNYDLPLLNVAMYDFNGIGIAPGTLTNGFVNFEPKYFISPSAVPNPIGQDSYMAGSYNLNSDIVVNAGVTLEMKPYAQINFPLNGALKCYGTLKVLGADGQLVSLYSNDASGAPQTWAGLLIQSTSQANEIRYAKVDKANIGIDLRGAWATIDHVTMDNFKDKGISLTGGAGGTISKNKIGISSTIRANHGLYLQDTVSTVAGYNLTISENQIENANYGVTFLNDTRAQLINKNVIRNHAAAGIQVIGNVTNVANVPTINFNYIYGNGPWNLRIEANPPADVTQLNPMFLDAAYNYWGATTIVYDTEEIIARNSIYTRVRTDLGEMVPRYRYILGLILMSTDPNDYDGDTLSNALEIKMGTSQYLSDSDRDGYFDNIDRFPTDAKEWLDTNNDGEGDNADDDDDGDKIPDTWEILYGFNPKDFTDATDDQDHDNLTNLQEFLIGTNPREKDTDYDGINDDVDPFPFLNIPAVMMIVNSLLLN